MSSTLTETDAQPAAANSAAPWHLGRILGRNHEAAIADLERDGLEIFRPCIVSMARPKLRSLSRSQRPFAARLLRPQRSVWLRGFLFLRGDFWVADFSRVGMICADGAPVTIPAAIIDRLQAYCDDGGALPGALSLRRAIGVTATGDALQAALDQPIADIGPELVVKVILGAAQQQEER